MKKIITVIIFHSAFFILHSSLAQSLSPKVLATNGGYFTGGGNSLSWTLGETFNTTLQNGNLMLTQGEQQPNIYLKILNLKAIIEGFYTSAGQMRPALYNNNQMLPANYCDSITVELHGVTAPYFRIASKKVILLTDGSAMAQFPLTLSNGSYYVVLRQRNSIETWSKNVVSFSSAVANFDFTAQ